MTELWSGQFGTDYTRRQPDSIAARTQVWLQLLMITGPIGSVLEVGANTGQNLRAILDLIPDCEIFACEPNEHARDELREIDATGRLTGDYADRLSFPDGVAELAFTCGVLIHIPPDKLIASIREIHRCARRYIICAEYFAPSEEMVPYRGLRDALWRRDYGSLYMDEFPDLQCIGHAFAWRRTTGLDNLTFWIFEKGNRRH